MSTPQTGHRQHGEWTLVVMALVCAVSCAGRTVESQAGPANELDGVWRLGFSETIGPDGTRRSGRTHESLLVISDGYYSMNYAFGPQKSEYFANRFNPTDAERLARYSSLLVNAGRFELDGGLLTIHPEFALVPEFVGGVGEFEYSLNGETLELVWRRIESGDGIPDPNTAAGVRYVTRWQRIPGVPSP
jgi:hypothetical protein